jgi:hypothetical protein
VAAIDAFAVEPGAVEVTRHDVAIAGLPRALEGLTIAHVSDVHLPRGVLAAQRTLELLAAERPDVVLLGGDLAEGAGTAPALAVFARAARGALATVAVLGNWEYAAGLGLRRARAAYRQAGVPLLVNASETLTVGDARVAIAGVDDLIWGAPDVRRAAAASDADVRIWLVHEPVLVERIPRGVDPPDLVVAGHTHGGQVRLPGLGHFVIPPGSGRFVRGWYHDTAAPLYVSRGIGTSGLNVRFFCRPELPVFTLRRAASYSAAARV